MRVVVQVVLEASVKVNDESIAKIGKGFLLFVGFTNTDEEELLPKMAKKVKNLRVFLDENGKSNLSLADVGGNILSVSQFTLYGSAKEGNRPSFVNAMHREKASPLFDKWNAIMREDFPDLQTGEFGADMKVSLVNDGPFTLLLDSEELFKEKKL